MATIFEIVLYTPVDSFEAWELKSIADEAFAVVDSLELRMSSWIPATQVSSINRNAGKGPVRVSTGISQVRNDEPPRMPMFQRGGDPVAEAVGNIRNTVTVSETVAHKTDVMLFGGN